MEEWKEGWINGWMDEWMNGWIDEWIFLLYFPQRPNERYRGRRLVLKKKILITVRSKKLSGSVISKQTYIYSTQTNTLYSTQYNERLYTKYTNMHSTQTYIVNKRNSSLYTANINCTSRKIQYKKYILNTYLSAYMSNIY